MSLSFDAIAEVFDDQRGLPSGAIRSLVAFVDSVAHGRELAIVEPGIGTGRVALPLAVAGHRIAGIDISRSMLDACAAKAAALGVADRVALGHGDATDLPYGDDAFDAGIVASLLYLVRDWESVLDELARVVRPGGAVVQLRERTETGNALSRWDRAWRDCIETAGFTHQSVLPTDDDVVAGMRRRWPDLEIRPLASWSFGQTVAAARQDYGDRLRPLYPTIPRDVWSGLVADFLGWTDAAFPDTIARLDGRVTLEAVTAWT